MSTLNKLLTVIIINNNNNNNNSESYRRYQHLFLQEEITFKTIEREKIIRELQKIENDLRTVMNFIDWTYISNKFTESNIKAIKRVEEIQNYKLSELMGTKLQHDPEKRDL